MKGEEKIMKKTLLLGLGACALALGGTAALLQTSMHKTLAEEPTLIYVDISKTTNWNNDSADTRLWVWEEGKDGSWATKHDLGDNLFSFEFPEACDYYKVVRYVSGWANESDRFDYSSTSNYVEVSESIGYSFTQKYVSKLTAETTFYVDAAWNGEWWANDYAKTYLFFFRGNNKKVLELSPIVNTSLYYANLGSDFYADGVIVVRGWSFTGASTDWNNGSIVANQSVDILYLATTDGANAITLSGLTNQEDGKYKYKCDAFTSASDAYFADSFAINLLRRDLCLDEGGLKGNASSIWTSLSNAYTATYALLTDKSYIASATKSSDGNLGKAIERYDAVISKNGVVNYPNFIDGHVVVPPANSAYIPQDALLLKRDGSAASAIVIASISAVALGGLFLLRKKRAE